MATIHHNLSDYIPENIPDASAMKIGIVVSEWNEEITFSLKKGALNTLFKHGVKEENIIITYVPGSFELIYGAKCMAEYIKPDAVIILGCVIKGDTPHFDYVCSGVTQGIASLNTQGSIPFIFGLLTTNDKQQALDRSGGKHGNKGDEAAITAIKMIDFTCKLK